MLTASAPVTGQPHSAAQQHLGDVPQSDVCTPRGVCLWVSRRVWRRASLCVSSTVCMCARVMDSEQTLSVRGAACQLIRCGRCSYQVLQQLLLTPPSIFPKWQASSIKEGGQRRGRGGLNPATDEAGRCLQRRRLGRNRSISHLIPFIC